MFKSILIPTDFTPAAWKAMQVGLMLGQMHKAKVSLLHVYPISSKFSSSEVSIDQSSGLDKVKANMEKIRANISQEKGLEITNIVLTGHVEKQLLAYVKEHQFDLVIMGVNSNNDDNSPGSHTVKMIEKSSTPVLVVPNSYTLDE